MMAEVFGQLLCDLRAERRSSPIYRHHIDPLNAVHYPRPMPYEKTDPCQIVIDYIAGMTDTYFIELHRYLFPESDLRVEIKGYFDEDAPSGKETEHV